MYPRAVPFFFPTTMTNLTDSEKIVALAGAALVGVVAVMRCLQWFWNVKPKPDPWGPEVEAALDDPQVLPACHRCFMPHAETDWFCPECGAAVGDYNNWSPYLQLFSVGEVLRDGTFGKPQHNWITVLGYLLLSVSQYIIFAPVYWVLFFMNLAGSPLQPRVKPTPSDPPPLPPVDF